MTTREAKMANKSVFKSATKGKTQLAADTTNRAGGKAYKLDSKSALAQYASTGTFNDAFYEKGDEQLAKTLALCTEVDPTFIAKTAIYSRESGRMKDMPALLCAHLASRGEEGLTLLKKVFPLVIDNGKMLRNFVQIIRSGATGRKSLGTAPKKLVQAWFESKPVDAIFKMSTGNDPSFADVIKMARPFPSTDERRALYGYLASVDPDKKHKVTVLSGDQEIEEERPWGYNPDYLPALIVEYEVFKKAKAADPAVKLTLPKIPWEMITGLPLSEDDWKALAHQATWTQIRMNLNTFARHNVFKDAALVKEIAAKIKDPELIEKAKPFPYQLLMAYLETLPNAELPGHYAHYAYPGTQKVEEAADVPKVVRSALHDAMEIATKNVPTIDGPVYVAVDVSGSMQSPVTGHRKGATSKARAVDVAALIGATFLRKNPGSEILPFSDGLFLNHGLEPKDSILTNAKKLAALGGGGTNMTSALLHLNKKKMKGDLIIIVSDCETWADGTGYGGYYGNSTSVAQAWAEYKTRNPKAKLVTINLQAGSTCQVKNDKDVMQLGGFSDTIWEVIKSFVEGMPSADHWVKVIEAIQLPDKV
jgi:60 kDa SS-A/Ro ribonucleoprotein